MDTVKWNKSIKQNIYIRKIGELDNKVDRID